MVYVLLGRGFEETEAIVPVDLLRRAGVEVQTVGIGGKTVEGGHGIPLVADITLDEMDMDAVFLHVPLAVGLQKIAPAVTMDSRGNHAQAFDAYHVLFNGNLTHIYPSISFK